MKVLALVILLLPLTVAAQNLNDAQDSNQVPSSLEPRENQNVNLPDFRDDDFIPSSQEPREEQEYQGGKNTPVKDDYGLDSNDRYTDEDNFGLDNN